MAIPALYGYLSSSVRLKKPHVLPLGLTALSHCTNCSTISAEKFYTHMLKTPENPERTLGAVDARLDSSCVIEVLRRFSSTKHAHLGLRFFFWAGTQRNYRHSSYMYDKACKLFEIDQEAERISEVVDAYRVEGCAVSVKLFKIVLALCREANAADQALWVLRKMADFGCRPDTTLYNIVIRLLCSKGELDLAAGLMREISSNGCYPDMITHVEMIKGFCNAGRTEEACDLLKAMKDGGLALNSVVYSALLDGLCKLGCFDKAMSLLEAMETEGGDSSPTVITYTSVIQRLCERGRVSEASHVFDRMEGAGCAPNHVTVHALVGGLCSEERVGEAYELVCKIAAGGSVKQGECYSSLVVSLLRIKRVAEAEEVFKWMLENSLPPDGLACRTLIETLCTEGRSLDGFNLCGSVEEKGFRLSIGSDVYAHLLDGLHRQNHRAEAAMLAGLMAEREILVKPASLQPIMSQVN